MVINRVCSKCNEVKGLELFSRDKTKKDGHRPECKKCHSQRSGESYHRRKHTKSTNSKFKRINDPAWLENERAKRRNWYKNNPEKTKEINLKAKFGINSFIFNQLLNSQDYKCGICGNKFDMTIKRSRLYPHVDHNHDTGEIRGILCANCNIGLGNFMDNESSLINAMFYLKNYPQKNKIPIYARSNTRQKRTA